MSDELPPIVLPEHLLCIGPAARAWITEPDDITEQLRRALKWATELEGQVKTILGMRNVRIHELRKTMTVREIEAATGLGHTTIGKH